ncbi:hypothetical protein IT413_02295 [Candidatus Peregrinibacteria bacterium]|nr:hypothetical protein [Candidatus Peregrinibacteria bacterium]
MSQEGFTTDPASATETIEVIGQENEEAIAQKKAEAEKAAAEKRAAEEKAAAELERKRQIEIVGETYRNSINAEVLTRRLLADEVARLKSRSKLPPEQVKVRLQAYLEQNVGVKAHIKPVTVTNIGTINNELKIVDGNSTRQPTDGMTLYFDDASVEKLQVDPNQFSRTKRITFIGTDPTPSLEERIQLEEQRIRELAPLMSAEDGETGEITHVRRIGERTKAESLSLISDRTSRPKSA